MNTEMPTSNDQESAENLLPGDPTPPNDWLIADMVDSGDLDFTHARTVGDVYGVIHAWLTEVRSSCCCSPAVFATGDGRLFTADVDVVIREATPEEVRDAVENEKDSERGMLVSRLKNLDAYLEGLTA